MRIISLQEHISQYQHIGGRPIIPLNAHIAHRPAKILLPQHIILPRKLIALTPNPHGQYRQLTNFRAIHNFLARPRKPSQHLNHHSHGPFDWDELGVDDGVHGEVGLVAGAVEDEVDQGELPPGEESVVREGRGVVGGVYAAQDQFAGVVVG
jgi:hypothetical protein